MSNTRRQFREFRSAKASARRATDFECSTVLSSPREHSSRFDQSTLQARKELARAGRRVLSRGVAALLVAVVATAAILIGVPRYLHARHVAAAVAARQASAM